MASIIGSFGVAAVGAQAAFRRAVRIPPAEAHQELLARGGVYARLHRAQFRPAEDAVPASRALA